MFVKLVLLITFFWCIFLNFTLLWNVYLDAEENKLLAEVSRSLQLCKDPWDRYILNSVIARARFP